MDARFTVFIPVWNDCRWLPCAIESVLAQTYPAWELIIGDNASSEDLASIAARYGDSRIVYHRWPTHTGIYENFNRTALLGRYEWVQLLCADDRLYPHCLERLAEGIARASAGGEPPVMVLGAARHIDPDGRAADRPYYGTQPVKVVAAGIYDDAAWLALMASPGLPPWNMGAVAVARRVIQESGGFFRPEVGVCSDHELAIRAAAYGRVVYIDEPLMAYTVRSGSDVSGRFFANRLRGDPRTPMAAALEWGLAAHAARRMVAPHERAAVAAAIARSYIERAGQHRVQPGGRGRPAALRDLGRALLHAPRVLLEPEWALRAVAALLARRGAIIWAREWLRARRHPSTVSRARDAASDGPTP